MSLPRWLAVGSADESERQAGARAAREPLVHIECTPAGEIVMRGGRHRRAEPAGVSQQASRDHHGRVIPPTRRWLSGSVLTVAVVGAVSVVIGLLAVRARTPTLEALFLLAVLGTGVMVSQFAVRSRQQARESARLAEEQAALRRVATLVARTVSLSELFETVSREVGLLSRADHARLDRYETDGTVTGVGGWSRDGERQPAVGTRLALEGVSIAALVRDRNRPVRLDSFAHASGRIAQEARAPGVGSSIGCPIIVEGRPWGAIAASSKGEAPFPADTESQLAEFSDLVATAIANANCHAELAGARARALTAADDTRRRLERDLHDGAQQRLIHTVLALKLARQALSDAGIPTVELVDEALEHAERATAELRDLAHGILPAPLKHGGLRAGIETLASRVRLPLSVDVTAERLPPALEATAYFIVAEALTNAVKHARARSAEISAFIDRGALHLEVRDDGIGGARVEGSSGLLGLRDRAAALGGELNVESPHGRGTVVGATLPVTGS
jgi:signal transduction histidine kinase